MKRAISVGVYDALSAKLAERAGFGLLFVSGFGVAGTYLGEPDLGLLTQAEILDVSRRIVKHYHIETRSVATRELSQKHGETVRIECWHLQIERRPGFGFNGSVEPVILIERRQGLFGTHASGRHTAATGQMQAHAGLILEE